MKTHGFGRRQDPLLSGNHRGGEQGRIAVWGRLWDTVTTPPFRHRLLTEPYPDSPGPSPTNGFKSLRGRAVIYSPTGLKYGERGQTAQLAVTRWGGLPERALLLYWTQESPAGLSGRTVILAVLSRPPTHLNDTPAGPFPRRKSSPGEHR